MGKPYPEDLRRNIVHAIESGHTYEEAAELCGVSVSSVSRFLTRWRNTGSVSPEKFGGYKGYALERYRHRITRWLGARPDITLAELQARLARERVAVSQTSIFRFLRHLDFTCSAHNRTGHRSTLQDGPNLGQPISHADLAEWDITVMPNGTGLPPGSGTSAQGKDLFSAQCAVCHGDSGKGG